VLTFRVLGPLEVRDGDLVIELPPGKQRVLLVALLMRAGEIVPTDTLIEQLWGETPPRTARGALVNNVSLLRKALGSDVLLTRPPGYLLDVVPVQTDLGQFEKLTAEARATQSVTERAEKLRQALTLWRGTPFADLAFESFAQLEISRLEDPRLAARQDLIDAELEYGSHADLLPELDTLIQQHSFDERLRGQQMLALYRAGRQADALLAYQTARRLLDDELGLEPGTELRELEQAVLRQDPELAAPMPTVAAVMPSRRTVTVLFADLVESTELAERLDPEALQAVRSKYFEEMRQAVERHGGTVEKFIGDAVMAVFGVPKAHEDDALRAVRAAVDIHDVLRGIEGGLEARIGVNTGEVFTGGETALVTGGTVNVAKRLEQAAPAGEILLGAPTLRLIRDAVKASRSSHSASAMLSPYLPSASQR
jgi:class 3 adenylate cyclase